MSKKFILGRKLAVPILAFTLAFGQMGAVSTSAAELSNINNDAKAAVLEMFEQMKSNAIVLPPPVVQRVAVRIDGEEVSFPDARPFITEGRTLIPIRAIAEGLGAEVEWKEATREVEFTKGTDTVILTIGSNIVSINGRNTTIDVPADIKDDRTFVPLRFVSEALGASVEWVSASRTVLIRTQPLTGLKDGSYEVKEIIEGWHMPEYSRVNGAGDIKPAGYDQAVTVRDTGKEMFVWVAINMGDKERLEGINFLERFMEAKFGSEVAQQIVDHASKKIDRYQNDVLDIKVDGYWIVAAGPGDVIQVSALKLP